MGLVKKTARGGYFSSDGRRGRLLRRKGGLGEELGWVLFLFLFSPDGESGRRLDLAEPFESFFLGLK